MGNLGREPFVIRMALITNFLEIAVSHSPSLNLDIFPIGSS